MLSQITQTLIATALLAKATQALELAAYWGQNAGNSQTALRDYCSDNTADIIIVSFVSDVSPLTLNLANICGTTFADGLLDCPSVGADITYCQQQGKKVLLSVGGSTSDGFTSDAEAISFADDLWNKFGAGTDSERPFGSAVVDGFDLDLETGDETGTVAFGGALQNLYAKETSKKFYLSGSPQCPYPDKSLGAFLSLVPVDFTFVQFYNNQCNLNADFNFMTWSNAVAASPNHNNNKIFIGLPGSESSALYGFADISTVQSAVEAYKCDPMFGGVSVWDASSSWSGYAQSLKNVLESASCPSTTTATTAAPTVPATTAAPTVPATSAVISTSAGPYANSSSTTTGDFTFTASDIQTTVITVTSCSDHKCTKVPVTTGLTTVTDVNTIYTTYCPLSGESTATSTADKEVVPATASTESNVAPITSTESTVAPTSAAEVDSTTTLNEVEESTSTYCPEESSASATSASAPATSAPVTSAPAPTVAPASSVETSTTLTVQVYSTVYNNGNGTNAVPSASQANMGNTMKGSVALVALSIFASLF